MKALFIAESYPNPSHGGGAVTLLCTAEAFQKAGYEVLWLITNSSQDTEIHHEGGEQGIVSIQGMKVLFVSLATNTHTSFAQILFNRLFQRVFLLRRITQSARHRINIYCKDIKPDIVVSYHWESLYLSYGVEAPIRVALVGDPMHLPGQYRKHGNYLWSGSHAFWPNAYTFVARLCDRLISCIRELIQFRVMKVLLKRNDIIGAFAYHHSVQLTKRTGYSCKYYRTPIPKPDVNWSIGNRHDVYTILMVGHLKGTATVAGLRILAYEILPVLDEYFRGMRYQLNIVGGYKDALPRDIKDLLFKHEAVRFIGPLDDVNIAFSKSDVLLVPTPIELGVRVRILTAFSYGIPVVTHTANVKGIPELKHFKNSLIANSGELLALNIAALRANSNLQELLSNGAIETYLNHFDANVAGSVIVEDATLLHMENLGKECIV